MRGIRESIRCNECRENSGCVSRHLFFLTINEGPPAQAGSGARMRGIREFRKCILTARGKIILCINTVIKPPEENTGKCPCISFTIP